MSRLIEIPGGGQGMPAELVVDVGDVLRFDATGGRVRAGTAVELVGILVDSVLGTDGTVLTPAGTPNVVLFRAGEPGRAGIDVVTGEPFRSPSTHHLTVVVRD